jgi:hypothetical protein
MPVFLFTFHGYMTWLPDNRRGYTKRGEEYQDPDEQAAQRYRARANNADECLFSDDLMRAMVDETLIACGKQDVRLHSATTETTHVHLLVSWGDDRDWMAVRSALKMSLSLRLKREAGQAVNTSRRDTEIKLSRSGSRKRAKDRDHFDDLVQKYLPSHSGSKYFEDRGFVAARRKR